MTLFGCSPITCFRWQVIFRRWIFRQQRSYRSITVPATSKSSGDSISARQRTFTMVPGLIYGGVKCNRRFPHPSPRSPENSPLRWPLLVASFPQPVPANVRPIPREEEIGDCIWRHCGELQAGNYSGGSPSPQKLWMSPEPWLSDTFIVAGKLLVAKNV